MINHHQMATLTKPMFVGQGDQMLFMNEVFLKYLTAPTITSSGNPPAFFHDTGRKADR
ncbi:hypothetical protein MOP93_21025 [Escherichia coli]|uniref:hypothetical protein n=1 Tax=Escherichia coli TaxID=562 RepID=UPI002148D5BA|nr:hypothetical protein [Escherichia coli]MCR1053503.1 hypothetical protein [Escherichia coli]